MEIFDHYIVSHTDLFSIKDLIATKLINVPAEIRKYWWENSENLINVPGTTISDSRVHASRSDYIKLEIVM